MSSGTRPVNFLYELRMRWGGSKVRRLLLHFLELQIPMVLGALLCYLLGRLIQPSSRFTESYHPGTYLFAVGDIFFLTVPVMAWMIFRGHRSRRSLEIVVSMIAPVATIMFVGELAATNYLLWLVTAMYPAMSLGMLFYNAPGHKLRFPQSKKAQFVTVKGIHAFPTKLFYQAG